jgi:hypothetical protein
LDVTVRNTGTTELRGWSTYFSFLGFQKIDNAWNAVVTQGREVQAVNESYNGTLAPGASTTWGAIVSGGTQPVSGLRCAPR